MLDKPSTVRPKPKTDNRPWTPAELSRLGKAPDSVLARRWGRTIKEVVSMREQQRIWTAGQLALLGKIPDAEVARRTGHPLRSVGARRRRQGLRPCAGATGPESAESGGA